jgi:membrane protein DedA with SNARE-associated domain
MVALLGLISTYGYFLVFCLVVVESAGVPVPGETSLLIAAALSATGQLWWPGVIVAAAAGAILGDTAGYWVGRTSGLRLLRRHGRLVRFDEAKLARAQVFFARHGDKTVFLGRFVPVGRIFTAVLAGIGRMHYGRFLAWNAAGGIVWALAMGTVGYLFGNQLPFIERTVRHFGFAMLAAIMLVLALQFAWRRSRKAAWLQRPQAPIERWWVANGPSVVAKVRLLSSARYRWQLVLATAVLATGMVALGGLVAVLM